MNIFIRIYAFLIFSSLLYSNYALAFACISTSTGTTIGVQGGAANVYVNLTPQIGVGQNLIVDLAPQIQCWNFDPSTYTDMVALNSGTTYRSQLSTLNGSVTYNGGSYGLPLSSATPEMLFMSSSPQGWPVTLYITPIGAAGSLVIAQGELIASLQLRQTNQFDKPNGIYQYFTWNIYANNSVIVPTGGCDVSSRNVNVTLPDYPGVTAVPLTVRCAQNQKLSYYLTGPTTSPANNIFTNTASSSPAVGVGVQLSNVNGVIATNNNVSLGVVGPSSVDLGLTASYARTGGQVIAGNVQSVVGVTFIYQ
ncbi:fimbrial protein [Pantoea ananatis]|uniref:fimbrial protein n=1 Tax=Pantoea ananas TaxID=553 RepID=UPI000F86048C|nr:fimbrial protein [Pantoea ananatis]RQN05296.1 fimbrial protein [Pantoea ananatis]